jgi:hypothetical protein
MKSGVSAALIGCLAAAPVAAQQADPGPIQRSIAFETARLAAAEPPGDAGQAWRRVVTLAAGKRVTLTDRDGQDSTGYLTLGDEGSLMLVHLEGAPIPPGAMRTLKEVAAHHPWYFSEVRHGGGSYVFGNEVRLEADGIYVSQQRLAGLDAVTTTIAKADVRQVTIREYRSSAGWVAAAAAGGVFAGLLTSAAIAFQPCNGSCGDEQLLMLGSVIGFPVLGGYGAYRATRHEVSHVLYSAP